MDKPSFVQTRVKHCYWEQDLNCATTTLLVLAESFGVELSGQVLDAALGMHGAGGYGAQCGLVEGMLMFLGLIGRRRGMTDKAIVDGCKAFAEAFEKRFASLKCSVLRPEGFAADNPPHLCEGFTCQAMAFNIEFLQALIGRPEAVPPPAR